MGVDQLPFLPTRRSSLTIPSNPEERNGKDARSHFIATEQVTDNHRSQGSCRENQHASHPRDGNASRPSSSSSSSQRKGGRNSHIVPAETFHRPSTKSLSPSSRSKLRHARPRRSRSFDGLSRLRRSPSPGLPTVQEFQRACFEREDERLLENFRRTRSWDDVRKCTKSRSPSIHSSGHRHSVPPQQSRKERLVVATNRTAAHADTQDHRSLPSPPLMTPNPCGYAGGWDSEQYLSKLSPNTRRKKAQASRKMLQATLQSLEDELYQSQSQKIKAWPRPLNEKTKKSGASDVIHATSVGNRNSAKVSKSLSPRPAPQTHTVTSQSEYSKRALDRASTIVNSSSRDTGNHNVPFTPTITMLAERRPAFDEYDGFMPRSKSMQSFQESRSKAPPITPQRTLSPMVSLRKASTKN